MLLVQVDMCLLRLSRRNDLEEPPPVGVSCDRWAGVLVQPILEFVRDKEENHRSDEDDRPVGDCECEEVGKHVESFLVVIVEGKRNELEGNT